MLHGLLSRDKATVCIAKQRVKPVSEGIGRSRLDRFFAGASVFVNVGDKGTIFKDGANWQTI